MLTASSSLQGIQGFPFSESHAFCLDAKNLTWTLFDHNYGTSCGWRPSLLGWSGLGWTGVMLLFCPHVRWKPVPCRAVWHAEQFCLQERWDELWRPTNGEVKMPLPPTAPPVGKQAKLKQSVRRFARFALACVSHPARFDAVCFSKSKTLNGLLSGTSPRHAEERQAGGWEAWEGQEGGREGLLGPIVARSWQEATSD